MAEINDKVLKKVSKNLNATISNLLYGGGGDARWGELAGAAACFKTLKLLGLKIKNEDDIRLELEGENVYNDNFLK